MGKKILGALALLGVLLTFSACGNNGKDPEIFLPEVLGPDGQSLEARRQRLCFDQPVDLENLLTAENFPAVFNCANYDYSLEGLRPLFTNPDFPRFLENLNVVLGAESTKDLKKTLEPWLGEGPEGTSRLDRLLPVLAAILKNASFQEALPVFHRLLVSGEKIWAKLLPGLAEAVYQERFPDNFSDLARLFGSAEEPRDRPVDYAGPVKRWAALAETQVEGRTVAERALDLAHRLRDLPIRGTSMPEYLDRANDWGVVTSLYLESGAARGEMIDPKLNADPEEDEIRDGVELTPAERQERTYRKLFARGPGGEDAPIVQLAGMIAELHGSHPDFLPAMARWFSANGARVSAGLTEYVVRARVISSLPRLSVEAFLAARETDPQRKVTGPEFEAFLREAFGGEAFRAWLVESLPALQREQFGHRNERLMRNSGIDRTITELYHLPAIAAFGASLVPAGKSIPLAQAIKRFSNLHRGEKLPLEYRGKVTTLETHLIDAWWAAANQTLGESVVLEFALQLTQTLFTDMAAQFAGRNISLSEWYYTSPYGNPASTEALAGYAYKELNLLGLHAKHKDYLKNELAPEIFPREEDQRAFRVIVDQVPNIWLYIKGGMLRSGNDLTRALAEKDGRYFIGGYMDLLAGAVRTGWWRDAVLLIDAYHRQFPPAEAQKFPREFEEVREISEGLDALKRVLRALLKPEEVANYATSTLSRMLVPISALVAPEGRPETERFLLVAAGELRNVPDEKLNAFLRDFLSEEGSDSIFERRETLRATAEVLRDPVLPELVRDLTGFFRDEAVKPALKYICEKIDDGSLPELLLFLRRILGFRV